MRPVEHPAPGGPAKTFLRAGLGRARQIPSHAAMSAIIPAIPRNCEAGPWTIILGARFLVDLALVLHADLFSRTIPKGGKGIMPSPAAGKRSRTTRSRKPGKCGLFRAARTGPRAVLRRPGNGLIPVASRPRVVEKKARTSSCSVSHRLIRRGFGGGLFPAGFSDRGPAPSARTGLSEPPPMGRVSRAPGFQAGPPCSFSTGGGATERKQKKKSEKRVGGPPSLNSSLLRSTSACGKPIPPSTSFRGSDASIEKKPAAQAIRSDIAQPLPESKPEVFRTF